jgi:ligand-binding sensor protein
MSIIKKLFVFKTFCEIIRSTQQAKQKSKHSGGKVKVYL